MPHGGLAGVQRMNTILKLAVITALVYFGFQFFSRNRTSAGYSAVTPEDIKRTVSEARTAHKRILIEVGSDGCVWCGRLGRLMSEDRGLRMAAEGFVRLHADLRSSAQLLFSYGQVPGTPHFFVLEEDGTLLSSQETDSLESGQSYDRGKLLAFLDRWRSAGGGSVPVTSGIIVYGRDDCSLTQGFLRELDSAGAEYTYKRFDDEAARVEAMSRMLASGMDPFGAGLPVVCVDGRFFVRPSLEQVLALYHGPLSPGRAKPGAGRGPAAGAAPAAQEAAAEGLFDISGIVTGDSAMAIIGGEAYRVGDSVGGYKLQKIGKDYVSFADPQGQTVTQKLKAE
ncbi:MAG: thioredoxin family protein [Elusimicrobia bacterium]|nr:thioredoxin family protein [Elusimicrobiota bacterium]